ncbi:putative PKS/NRPS-like protein biosynthetic cluster [Coccidioides posadasii str. Silveira]|uniref:Uncharacterized protein n=1 Tax=Coccidioides posadasii (strain RMSCC 757 / Silveira) TaxID=443226 RepID=E9D6Z0_COCPS|nr:conserved hypothetical protein [Coccidioides posadasii str. Silveira]QVM10021.1 putative PKS/NRPS-like protein biosynthetic cluster [Coccidioides posadasii str. Silveira]
MSHDQDIRWTFKSLGEEKDLLISYFTSLRGSAQSADLIPTFSSHDDICLSLNQTLALLDFISTNPPDDTILQLLHRAFKCELLCGGDIHSLALKLEPSSSRKLIEAYFRTIGRFREMSTSALFERANIDDISLLAVFGGQGIHNLDCLTELRNIYHTYKPLIGDFIQRAALNLQNIALRCSDSADGPFYAKLDIHDWLFGPSEKCPGREHIATAPISFPINGLTSFAHYAIACHVLNLHPGEMRVRFSGAAGHSQGVIVAAAIAGSDSWSRFHDLVDRSLELLFWIGLKSHQSFNHSVLQPAVVSSDGNQNAVAHSMLSIRGMRKVKLQELLQQSNSCLGESEAAYLSLQNSDDAFVVAGPTKTLRGICQLLEKRKVAPNESQAKIPFPDRAPNIDYQLLPISAPFHSPHLQNVTQEVLQQVGAELLAELDLRIPVYHTRTGADLRDITGTDLTAELVRMITCEQVFWREACLKDDITHIIDFGPGRSSCLLLNQIQGSGTRIILVSEPTDSTSLYGGKHEFFSSEKPFFAPKWSHIHRAKLIRDEGNLKIRTPMTEIFGTPPVMVGGMTPTTVAWDFVSHVMNAGYHIELAAGGYAKPEDLEFAIRRLATSIPPHRGITLNVIYANPKAILWQIPLIRQLISDGLPVEGLTIGAGIPSLEVASEYIHTLGLKHISFKPGSVDAIDQVIKIAEANESFPIALQWTGGRGGGHHSYEDVHAPILKTYARIRKRKNIILIIGSGFGDAQGMLPYLTGSWSETFDYPPMPFDGVLLGSRMMVSKEAHTSPRVKDLIVQTKGTSDADWFATYSGSAGGVITVKSEMGEPIHKLATRAVLLWNDLDRTVFRIKEPAKRLEALLARRESIISRLNTDYCRPWFAIDSSGNAVELEDLTYAGCLLRVVNLMYLPQQRRWVHPSYLRFFLDFLRRVEERLCHSTSSVVAKESSNPFKLVDSLHRDCPKLSTELIYPEDVSYFLALCRRRGQKPVNFIPRLDENFEVYFKKDSLWQMENLEAVIDQDPQRVCIIHGPVAAKYSTSTEESAGQILDGICNDLLSSLASGQHENRENLTALSKTPTEQPLAGIFPCASFTSDQMHNVYTFTSSVTDIEKNRILEHALGGVNQWLQACFSEQYIRRANIQDHNPLPIAFRPVTGDALIVRYHGSTRQVRSVTLSRNSPWQNTPYPALSLSSSDGKQVRVTIQTPPDLSRRVSHLRYELHLTEAGGRFVINDKTGQRLERIRKFYASRWMLEYGACANTDITLPFFQEEMTLSQKMVDSFAAVVAGAQGNYSPPLSTQRLAPLDLGIVCAWSVLMKPLLATGVGGDLFRLLHRSNTFEMFPDAKPLEIGDVVQANSRVTAIRAQPKGKLVEVSATITRRQEPVMTVTSAFFIQGESQPSGPMFQRLQEPEMIVRVTTQKLEALLHSRKWIKFDDGPKTKLHHKCLAFRTESYSIYAQSSASYGLEVIGTISCMVDGKQLSRVGEINYSHPHCHGNPVTEFLNRYGEPLKQRQHLERPGWDKSASWVMEIPAFASRDYATVSTDNNPIHVCSIFAGLARLSEPIVHGMYTSAFVRRELENRLAESDRSRFRRWYTSFESPVHEGDALRVEVEHTSMVQGRMVFNVHVFNNASNEIVMKAEAEVEQPPTAYLFCGQGSQEKGMGMTLYDNDEAAREIWDRGDRYLLDRYGFSVIDVIRQNPSKLTVHFRTAKGRRVRENYLAITRRVVENGREVQVPIMAGLTPESESYTFHNPTGLLFSTQFAQPAISLMNLAEMARLESRGLVQSDATFAGHSLGEYSALAACAGVLSVEDLIALTFYRGVVMQNMMDGDTTGQTDFSMVAVNPSRVKKDFTQESLIILTKQISSNMGLLLEVVNYNVYQQQYVCAGHLQALWLLGKVCDHLANDTRAGTDTPEALLEIVQRHEPAARSQKAPVQLDRGKATVPLLGINVPFHSSYLQGGIDTYREYLKDKIKEEKIDPLRLVGKFVPNVMGKPFSVQKPYVEDVARVTGSRVLQQMLESWA